MRGRGSCDTVRRDGSAGRTRMGGRKKIVVLVGMAIACLTTLLLLLHDWNSEVNRLTARVERTTGLAIVTGGSARLTLLPPALMVENIVARQGDNPVAQIKRLSLQVSPLSLLTGQVQVNGLVVDHLRVGGASIDSLTLHVAPHKLEGFSKWNGHAVTFAASLSATDEQAAQFRLTIPTLNTALRFEGMVEKGPALSGHMVLNAGNLAGLLPDYALPPGRTLQAEADMDWGDGQFSLVNLTLQTGDTRAGGSLTLLAGSPALVDADLDVDSLNLESWQGAKSAALPALLPASLTPPANGAAKLAAGTETPAPASPLGVALPQDMFGQPSPAYRPIVLAGADIPRAGPAGRSGPRQCGGSPCRGAVGAGLAGRCGRGFRTRPIYRPAAPERPRIVGP